MTQSCIWKHYLLFFKAVLNDSFSLTINYIWVNETRAGSVPLHILLYAVCLPASGYTYSTQIKIASVLQRLGSCLVYCST